MSANRKRAKSYDRNKHPKRHWNIDTFQRY